MIKTGLWIELEVLIGFVVGWACIAHRTADRGGHHDDRARGGPDAHPVEGAHPSPGESATGGRWSRHGTPRSRGTARTRRWRGGPAGGSGNAGLLPESTTVAVAVIVAWLVVWSALGAWRMMTRDA